MGEYVAASFFSETPVTDPTVAGVSRSTSLASDVRGTGTPTLVRVDRAAADRHHSK